jgi:hypothetical protein
MRRAFEIGLEVNPRSVYQNLRLEKPFALQADVKAFNERELFSGVFVASDTPVFSTGDRFPLEVLRRLLES